MRKLSSIVLLLILCFALSTLPLVGAAEDYWMSRASMNEARGNFGIGVVNGKIYAFGGDNGSPLGSATPAEVRTAHTVSTSEEYNPARNIWTFKAPMPTARALLGVAEYENKIYCIGGYSGGNYNGTGVNEAYDPATNTWETLTSMPKFDYFATANTINGKIYVQSRNLNQAYDPQTDSWTSKAPPPNDVISWVSAVVDNKIYLIAMLRNSSRAWTGSAIQSYDPSNDSWSVGSESPTLGLSAAGATTGMYSPKQIYFFDETETNVYDPLTDSWTPATSMLTPRVLTRAAVINDTFYVVGGRSGQHNIITIMHPDATNEHYIPIGYIPEFPSWIILPLLIVATVIVVIARRKLLRKVRMRKL